MSRRVAFNTLGCKLNQHETESIASQFAQAGWEIVEFGEPADAYVLNTCTVTNKADRKSRNMINRALRNVGIDEEGAQSAAGSQAVAEARQAAAGNRGPVSEAGAADGPAGTPVGGSSPEPLVVVTGCFVNSHKEQLEQEGRTFVVDNDRKSHIYELVDAHFRGEMLHPSEMEPDVFSYTTQEPVYRTRSMVKIQDGCDNFCTFCIIPYVRGTAQSRPSEEVLMSVAEQVRRGYKEVVLTGVNMSRYNADGIGFGGLVQRILELPGDFRLRISSLEPDRLDDQFFEALEHPKMSPHLHLCLQSGSERMLLRMRRQYTRDQFKEIAERIRARQPHFNLTTDIIVGFPGETEEDFQESCLIAEELEFSHIHTFKYSRRKGTRADRMPDQIDEQTKSERSERIREISERNKRRYRERLVGTTERLLSERVEVQNGRSYVRGYGGHYAPIVAEVPEPEQNRFYDLQIGDIDTTGDEPVLIGALG
jgi:threonylcarbamoyladenosine tRNA methylthiotransferase MtaB